MAWKVKYEPEVQSFVDDLARKLPRARHQVQKVIDLLKTFGPELANTKHCEPIEDGLWALRTNCGNVQIRLFYFWYEDQAFVIIHACRKEKKIPQDEIKKALGIKNALQQSLAKRKR
jgi:phage-related protein